MARIQIGPHSNVFSRLFFLNINGENQSTKWQFGQPILSIYTAELNAVFILTILEPSGHEMGESPMTILMAFFFWQTAALSAVA